MLDLELIEETINELEQDVTSFENCEKLASLYICREMNKNANIRPIQGEYTQLQQTDPVKQELQDILPAYSKYVETKRRYQQYEVVDKMLVYAMEELCNELVEFIGGLYHNTETPAERALLIKMVNEDIRSAI